MSLNRQDGVTFMPDWLATPVVARTLIPISSAQGGRAQTIVGPIVLWRSLKVPTQVLVAAHYPDAADALFDRARNFADLIEATRKISNYEGLPETEMEEGATYNTNIRILGLVRCNDYRIKVNKVCHASRRVETVESNNVVRLWSHHLQIKPMQDGAIWIDRVILDAGAMTPIVSRYARFMYQHRHRSRNGRVIHATLSKSSRAITPQVPLFHPVD